MLISVMEQLTRVEQEIRRWKVLAMAAGAGLGLVVLLGAAGGKVAEEIRATRFVVVDAHGAPRGGLHVGTDGRSSVTLTDQRGRPHALVFVEADGRPGLALYDQAGRPRTLWGLDTEGTPALVLNDQGGTMRARVFVRADGRPGVDLYDQTGKLIWRAP